MEGGEDFFGEKEGEEDVGKDVETCINLFWIYTPFIFYHFIPLSVIN